MSLTFRAYGSRGSSPVSGPGFNRYGGETSCFSFETPEGLLIIDAGTGLLNLSQELKERETFPPITIVFTHFHLDHVFGLPNFSLLHCPEADIRIMSDPCQFPNWRKTIIGLMQKPFWPVPFDELAAKVALHDLDGNANHLELYGMRLSWCSIGHPQGCLAYRVDGAGASIVLATDREYDWAEDNRFNAFAGRPDLLIHDAQFTPEEFSDYVGWGHSTWEHAVEVAEKVGAKQLALTSHAPFREDDGVDAILESARKQFHNTIALKTGTELVWP